MAERSDRLAERVMNFVAEIRLLANWWRWYRAPRTWDGHRLANVATENFLIRAMYERSEKELKVLSAELQEKRHLLRYLKDEVVALDDLNDRMAYAEWDLQLEDLLNHISKVSVL